MAGKGGTWPNGEAQSVRDVYDKQQDISSGDKGGREAEAEAG